MVAWTAVMVGASGTPSSGTPMVDEREAVASAFLRSATRSSKPAFPKPSTIGQPKKSPVAEYFSTQLFIEFF